MAASMTGYGRNETTEEKWSHVWEIRSVNGRFLDVKWRLPHTLRSLETTFEKVVRAKASRGRVDISLNIEFHDASNGSYTLNEQAATSIIEQMTAFAEKLGTTFEPDLNRLMGMSSMWKDQNAEPDPSLKDSLIEGLDKALDDWNRARREEGADMIADLSARLEFLKEVAGKIREEVPNILEYRIAALNKRIGDILESHGVEYSEERMLQEVAILTDKLDVSEELTRLDAHLNRLEELYASKEDIGKKLDFLLQETFREINTCGNKAQSTDVSRLVVDFKAELEKCREQVQNIE